MCQPGKPSPHGDGHLMSRPGSWACFQSAKSAGSRLSDSTSTRWPSRVSSTFCPDSLPYPGNSDTS